MNGLQIALIALGALTICVLLTSFVCFMKCFYSPRRNKKESDKIELPPSSYYDGIYEDMKKWINDARTLPHKTYKIKSYDGLTLVGNYYECKKGAPVEILFHGYRGNAERDMSAAIERCFALERNALIVNQRASGLSEGHVITFGLRERYDCLKWIDFVISELGSDVKIILTGVSMGGSTVMLASGENLPSNVVCILSDCAFSSAKEIICKTIRDMHLPPKLLFPFVKLGALLFGHFRLEKDTPYKAAKRARVPVIFIHGEEDSYVPYEMSISLFDACGSKIKKIVTIPRAKHGVSFPTNKEMYLSALREFEKEWMNNEQKSQVDLDK